MSLCFVYLLLLLLLVKLSANPQYIMQWSAIKIILATYMLPLHFVLPVVEIIVL